MNMLQEQLSTELDLYSQKQKMNTLKAGSIITQKARVI